MAMNKHTKIQPPLIGENKEIFQLLVDAVSDYAIYALDLKGYVLTWNSGGERLKGYSASEIIGKHFSAFYTKEDIENHLPEHGLFEAEKKGTYEDEGWQVRKDGTSFWASIVITALWDENDLLRGFAKVTRDLSETKATEQERTQDLAVAKEEVERAVQARNEFLSIASHELKTPLTSLKLQIQNRKRHLVKNNFAEFSSEGLTKMVNRDEKQINRLIKLVDDMLDISRLTAGKLSFEFEETNLNNLVNDVVDRFTHQAASNGTQIHLKVGAQVIGIWDMYRIEQVVTNLLTNAMKYGIGKPIHIKISADDKNAFFSIKDQGPGIPKEDQYRIFLQFERGISSNAVSGLGLGLYMANQIVVAHHGQITVESEPGIGSTFSVVLPKKFNQ